MGCTEGSRGHQAAGEITHDTGAGFGHQAGFLSRARDTSTSGFGADGYLRRGERNLPRVHARVFDTFGWRAA